MINKLIKNIENFINSFRSIEFYLIIEINLQYIQYGILLHQGESYEILYTDIETNWITYDGIIYDYAQLITIINNIHKKIYNLYDINLDKIIITLSIPGVNLVNFHDKIDKFQSYNQGITLYKCPNDVAIIHNCGQIYIIDGNLPIENPDNIIYNTLDIYENYLIINKTLHQEIIHQMDSVPIKTVNIYSSHYFLSASLSYQLNSDVILIDIQWNSTIITVNHNKFSYGYWYWNKGAEFIMNNKQINLENLNNFLLDLQSIIINYSKATIVIGGYKVISFNWVFHLQKLLSNKMLYLNQLTNNNHNNIFLSLINIYPQILLENIKKDSDIFHSIESIIL